MVTPPQEKLNNIQNPTKPSSLRRFVARIRPYGGAIAAALFFGIARYLIPLALPMAVKVLVDEFLTAGGPPPDADRKLGVLMAGLCALYAVYAVVSYLRSFLSGRVGHQIIFDLRQSLYLHIQKLSLSFFEKQKVGAIVARMTSDIASAQNFVGAALVNTLMDFACVGAILVVLCVWHWKLALVALSIIPCYALLSRYLTRRIKQNSRDIHDAFQEISGDLHEQFAGMSTIQSFTGEDAAAAEFAEQSKKYYDQVLSNVRLQSIALAVTGFLTGIGPILVLWFGVHEVWSGRMTVGTLMAYYAYLGMLYMPIQRLTELNLTLTNSLAAMDRIFEVFDQYPDVADRPGARAIGPVRGEITFDRVGFTYPGRAPVLTDFSLHIEPGTTVALVGPSGAGKSTVVKLLPRFYDVTSGAIRLDGVDVRSVTLRSLREKISVVAQDTTLFSGTIEENLRYGRPGATREEIRAAARAAFAEAFIERLPKGYETEIGERGAMLSGGQKQRLAIARAFLKNAPVVILDEPTSALDAESEELVKKSLESLLAGRTALIIAHRLSTVRHADRVIVLDRGRIVEDGRHEDLLRHEDGLYRRYASRQLSVPL